ncbi:MAG: exopolyphosphatase [Bacteroidota bacterium]
MRRAVIDLGTNTFHILIADRLQDDYKIVYKEKVPVKIGEGGIELKQITDSAIDRALKAVKHFEALISKYEVDDVKCIATSAFRNAENGEKLAEMIKANSGIDVHIIDGQTEASLVLEGVKKAIDLDEDASLVIDIGGGSVEVIIADRNQKYWSESFEIGAQRLLDKFHKSDPITIDEIISIDEYFESTFSKLEQAITEFQPKILIGSSGTFDTLIEIYYAEKSIEKPANQSGYELSRKDFNLIYDELISKNREERMEIPGMIEMRVDMIVVAVQLIRFLLEKFNFDLIKISSYALKEGLLYSELHNKEV